VNGNLGRANYNRERWIFNVYVWVDDNEDTGFSFRSFVSFMLEGNYGTSEMTTRILLRDENKASKYIMLQCPASGTRKHTLSKVPGNDCLWLNAGSRF